MGGASKGRVKKTRTPKSITPNSAATRSLVNELTNSHLMRRGLNRFTRSSVTPVDRFDPASIDRLFNQFKEPNADKIGPEGMQALFDALDVDPLDIISLVFAWKLHATVPFEFSRSEFVSGCTVLKVDSIEKLKAVLPSLKESLDNESNFRSFYMFAFDYNKPPEQRSLPIETARQLFPLILEGRFTHLDLWNEFLQNRKHAISRDTYSLLLDFAQNIDDDFTNFDEENGAWPVLLDEFVEFAKPRLSASKDRMDF
eukprot:GFKZ01000444.1.p1 GENE.GFKZ01000444.1~~GFKZ01000444.1.p1  ORF type:complete len:256 (-),score=37.17 GFKZ01000444.1:738-1505(-)